MKHHPHHKPPWWPENEEWRHSYGWRGMRHKPFFRRVGCLFALFNLSGLVILAGAITFILNYFGVVHTQIILSSWLLIPAGIIFSFFIVILLVFASVRLRRMSIPLDEVLSATQKIASGDFSVRLEENGWREVRSLARGFNKMIDSLKINDQQRRNMLADISHELRNPITIIQGNLEGMLDDLYPANKETLKSLYEETQILARLVDDLKTFSLAEAGALPLKRVLTDLSQLIPEAVSMVNAQALEKEIKFELLLDEVSEIEIDPLRVQEVLINLLTNALRHTPRQGVIKVSLTESGSGGESDALNSSKRGVQVFVHDSGAGIALEQLEHIFDRFYKSSDSGGMGLGLSIAKVLVEAHGGRIWAENDNGCKVLFTLH